MRLSSYIDDRFIFTDLEAGTKEEVIKEVVERIGKVEKKVEEMRGDILKGILAREGEISTCMGMGLAIPHARVDGFDDFIVGVATVKKPIKCQVAALKEEDNVEIFVVIISEVLKNKRMLKLMAGVVKLASRHQDIFNRIKKSKSPSEIHKLIKDMDIEVDGRIVAEDVMSPDLQPIRLDDTLNEVAKRLIIEDRMGLPVVDEGGRFLGEITERELIEFGMPKYISVMQDLSFLTVGEPFEEYLINEKKTCIKDIYRKDGVITVRRNEAIMEVCFLIVNKGKSRLYVVEDGRYLGMIQRSDIIKKILHI